MVTGISPRQAAVAAYAAAAINLAAAVAMLVLLQPGMPVEGSLLAARIEYVSLHPNLWWAGWLLWHAAAISLVAFYIGLGSVCGKLSPLPATLGILCSVAGLAADLSAEALYMGLGPGADPQFFPMLERTAGLLTGYLGNGLYAIAGILLTFAAARELPMPLVILSVPLWVVALLLSAATLIGSARGQFWSTALLMPLVVIWISLVGYWLNKRAS